MKAWAGILCVMFAVCSCSHDKSSEQVASRVDANQVIEYHVKDNEYSVVVVQTEGLSRSDAKQAALVKAAQMTKKKKCTYFTVETEGAVQATNTSGSGYENPNGPNNLYYEMIQSDNFGRNKFEGNASPSTQIYPAYRITFKVYEEKPSSSAIDACSLTECK